MSDSRTPLDVLKAARKRIEDPKNWCQNSAYGRYVNNKPTAWCMVGAIWEETGGCSNSLTERCENILKEIIDGNESIPHFNDYHSHEEVLALFDRVIGDL